MAAHEGKTDIRLSRFPLKQGWDALSLARLALSPEYSVAAKARCLAFYFTAGGIRNLYATLTRSGSHWSLLGIALARDLAQGGKAEYDFVDDAWIPHAGTLYSKLDWREPAGVWDPKTDAAILPIAETLKMVKAGKPGVMSRPVLFHSHLPYCRIRCARLAQMRTAVMLRPIYDSMESKYHKHQIVIGMGLVPSEYRADANDPPSPANEFNFPWEALVDDAIEFYNSWGDALARHRNTALFRYDDLVADPPRAHKALTDFWGLNLPLECLEEAFRRISKAEMRKKIPSGDPSTTSRVAFRTQGAALSKARIAFIRDRLERGLIHDFGYGTEWRRTNVAA